jgi:hypothetical protein
MYENANVFFTLDNILCLRKLADDSLVNIGLHEVTDNDRWLDYRSVWLTVGVMLIVHIVIHVNENLIMLKDKYFN